MLTTSNPIMKIKSVIADIEGQFSGGKPKNVTLSELFNNKYAAKIPQIAPEAPSEDDAKLFFNTHEVRDAKLPRAPQPR